ncbi:SDR family NAD(P)-dependent oxidoreductase [Pseudarthrobacter sp. R1]|uniref:SDR family NAD(P)-dependent oxidoreductase n=1 Tax=Pseudarthrobacter sp. R1 TaxID=2944934 RepID=UPI00210E06C1|nr:SDR family NAD(P)-dependent oxidoreductase [Pseudarthrobacter sp. R1]MCQ6271440.1 SDR family NAD(P)-dependent oxidoreductase [Pseudarthrobacter sp. R1]
MNLENKVFVVTGAGNGIGREVALELLRRGGHVAAVDLSPKGLAETASLAGAPTSGLSLHAMNITERGAVEALPARVLEEHSQIDGLVNVAGVIHRFVPIKELSVEEIERVMSVNFWGTLYMVKAFLPELLQRPAASLVNVSSMGGLVPSPGQGAYGASKAAVKLFTETLYAELRDTNIKVTCVFPGSVGTDILSNSGVTLDTSKIAAPNGKAPKMTSPQDAGGQIVNAIASGAVRVLIGTDARGVDRLGRLSPTRAIEIVADRVKVLIG